MSTVKLLLLAQCVYVKRNIIRLDHSQRKKKPACPILSAMMTAILMADLDNFPGEVGTHRLSSAPVDVKRPLTSICQVTTVVPEAMDFLFANLLRCIIGENERIKKSETEFIHLCANTRDCDDAQA